MVTSHMHISDTWLTCRHRKEAEEWWEDPHLTNGNTDELLYSECVAHFPSYAVFLYIHSPCERKFRVETEKILCWNNVVTEMHPQTITGRGREGAIAKSDNSLHDSQCWYKTITFLIKTVELQ